MHRGFTDLPTANPTPFPWAPSGIEDWKEYTIVLDNEEYLTEFFRVQFEFESRLGNNIYLDDINVQGFGNTAVSEAMNGLTNSWNLAPNPAVTSSVIAFQIRKAGMASLMLQDASGRVLSSTSREFARGSHDWEVVAPTIPGVYLLRLATEEGAQRTWRWVIQ